VRTSAGKRGIDRGRSIIIGEHQGSIGEHQGSPAERTGRAAESCRSGLYAHRKTV